MKTLLGKTALVTGGSRGIGKAIVKKFASEGANVVFTYVSNKNEAEKLKDELSSLGLKINCYLCDGSNFDKVKDLYDTIASEYDLSSIDILVNNAGITRDSLIMRMSESTWDEVINVNLKSAFNFIKIFTPLFMKNKRGSIINMSSVVGLTGNAGQANYSASKAGIIGLTKSIALELGSRNIRANAIAPGFIITDMTATLTEDIKNKWEHSIPLKRLGTADEVANCALFLASDTSSYITGQVIQVDGGILT